MTAPQFIRPDWPAPPSVRAASSTRIGGVSAGPYASLNFGRSGGDDPNAVDENRRRAFATLGLAVEPNWLRQVHGARVVRAPLAAPVPEADACFTTEENVVCLVQSADCMPVLFCDDAGSVVAAAHAGWRGLAAGVLENTLRALDVAPASVMAWLGPAIGPQAFEVGAEVRSAFIDADSHAAHAFAPAAAADKFMADLYLLARQRLARAGVTRVSGGGLCTYTDKTRFFSHRREGQSNGHNNGGCGRMASLIWLAPVEK